MRLNQLLQLCVLALLLIPLVGLTPSGLIQAGYDATASDLRQLLRDADRSGRLGSGTRHLMALLSPSADDLAFTQANVDKNIKTAENGYRLLRRVTKDRLLKGLTSRPGAAIDRLTTAVGDELSKASLDNLRRAVEDPLRLPPEARRLLAAALELSRR